MAESGKRLGDGTPSIEQWDSAYQAVGQFMFQWAVLENAMNQHVQSAMGLRSMEGAIVCANLQVRDKLHIIHTALGLLTGNDKDRKKEVKTLMKRLSAMAADRNIVAHRFFAPAVDGDGVEFFVSQAKGKLTFPVTIWTNKTLEEKYEELRALANIIRPPERRVGRSMFGLGQSYADMSPSANTELRGLLSRALLQSQGDQDGPESNRPPAREIPGDPLREVKLPSLADLVEATPAKLHEKARKGLAQVRKAKTSLGRRAKGKAKPSE